MKNHFHLHWFLIFLFFPLFLNAQLRVAKVFSDNMVLQRDKAIPVWGWANAGETITVTFNEQGKKTTASEDGAWKVELEALSAGGPFEMKIKDSKEEIILSNILMGDVWICSGQSNMAWSVKNSNNPEEEIANAKDSKIRHFTVPRKGSEQIEKDLPGGTWEVCSSETAGEFTAVGYYFARALRANNNVPIGLLNTSWGGSRVEAWMSAEALGESDAKAALELSLIHI